MTAARDPRALTRELLAFNTINPPGMERACAHLLGSMLQGAGFRTEYHEFAEGRTSLIARIGAGNGKPLCFTGHIDTVPLGAAHGATTPSPGRPTATSSLGAARPT
jgi:succinyl-diaminopimelate desuccinylase